MGAKVDRAIADVMSKGNTKSSAIAILKSRGVIHQSGRHLASGPPNSPARMQAKRQAAYRQGRRAS